MPLNASHCSVVKARSSSFPSGQKHGGPDWYQRLLRAHANCCENLPIFTAIVLTNVATGGHADLDGLARLYLAARVGQSLTHWASTSDMMINVRFTFFVAQMGLAAAMGLRTFNALG